MRLTILGCRSGMPYGGQCSSGYLVSTSSTKILLDCGPGTATALSAVGHPAFLDGVVISHLHVDHCYDLLPLGKALLTGRMAYPVPFPTLDFSAMHPCADPIPLYVPTGGRGTLDALARLFPVNTLPILNSAFSKAFDVREYEPGDVFSVGDCEITMHGLRHAVPNCGTRIESSGGSLAYTGDTGMTAALVDLARDVDLLLSEATLEISDDSDHGHLCAQDAGEVAAEAGAGELVLTHFVTDDPDWLSARQKDAQRIFDGPVHIARPAGIFDIGSR